MPDVLTADELARITSDLDEIEAMASAIATPEHGQVGFINMRRLLVTIAARDAKLLRARAYYRERMSAYGYDMDAQMKIYGASIAAVKVASDE